MLRNRGLAPLLAAEVVSSLGTHMTYLALPWFVLVATGLPRADGRTRAPLATRAPLMAAIPVLHALDVLTFPLFACVFLLGCFIAPYSSSQRVILPELVGDAAPDPAT